MAEISMAENLCSLCSNTIKKPKILRCRHVFCKKCLGKQKTGCIHCPVCKQDTKLLKDGVRTIPPCDKCEATSSQFRCQDCEEYLCQVCRSRHADIKMCKNHNISDEREKAEGKKKKKGKEPLTTHEKNFCRCDGKRKVGYLCLDCSELICYKCYINDHTKHENLDVREDQVNKQIHSDLSSLQDRVKVHSEKLLKFFEVLMEKKTEVNKTVLLLKNQIDQQVADICNEVKKTGETMKTDIEQIYYPDQMNAEKDGSVNLSTLLEGVKQEKQNMATFLKKAATDLKEKCTIPMWSRLHKFREEEEEKLLSRKMQVPDIPATQYKPLEVNKELLAAQFGEIVTNNGVFEHTFRLDEIGSDKNYCSPMISCMSRAWSVNMWQWFNNEVCLGLQLNKTEETSYAPYKFIYTLTIVNENDEDLSLVKHGTDTFTPGDNPSRYLFIPKGRLTDPKQGFTRNGKFRIKVDLNKYAENTDEKEDKYAENTDEKEDIDEQICKQNQGSNQEHIERQINGHIYIIEDEDDENSDMEHSNILFM